MRQWLRGLDPQLPRSVYALQLGGLLNSVGNGIVLPFTLIYLHNVRGIALGLAGLILATNAFVGLVAGPLSGVLVDRLGGRAMLAAALVCLAVGYSAFALVREPWQGFVAATIAGAGNGVFWPAQSTLLAGLTPAERRPAAWGMQRVVMNLGIGLGALVGGLVVTTDDPRSFELLFAADALTFVAYLAVLLVLVPEPRRADERRQAPGSYRDVLRDTAFMWVIGVNTLFILAGMSGFELLPVYAKNTAGVDEAAIGAVFFVNTVVIVLAQLPVTKLSEGHRRTRALALLGVVWAVCWVVVPLVGTTLTGRDAAIALGAVMAVFAIGECLHGAVQGPLVADLAAPSLVGRYMALSALSWQVGFALGPAIGASALERSESGVWLAAAAICLAASGLALSLERRLPAHARRTPVSVIEPGVDREGAAGKMAK